MRVTQRRSLPRGLARRMAGSGARLGVVLCVVAALGGCRAQAGSGTVTPGRGNHAVPDGPDPEGPHEQTSDISRHAELLQALRTRHAEVSATSDATFGVCEELCSLASQICTVKEKLCDIADDLPGEDDYRDLCRKGELECNEAEESCVECVESRQSEEPPLSSEPPE
ncbi:MAG: hypothetical protein AAF799_08685 [Myxococcota bacterium]